MLRAGRIRIEVVKSRSSFLQSHCASCGAHCKHVITYIRILLSLNPQKNLDIQYTVGIATDVPVEFISVGFDNADDIGEFLDQINFLINQPNVPTVLTTSYGFDENDVTESLARYARRGSSL